jgi:hypothetical protein
MPRSGHRHETCKGDTSPATAAAHPLQTVKLTHYQGLERTSLGQFRVRQCAK